MEKKKLTGKSREMPHTHVYHILMPVIFIFVWMLDSQIFHLTTWLNIFVHYEIRLIGFIIIFVAGLIFIQLSHTALFKDKEPLEGLITKGVLGHTRNPMYFGISLFYISLLFFSMSLMSLLLFIPIFLIYNKMANFEAKLLEDMFGSAYLEYKKKVPKWIPSLKSKYPK